MTAAPFMAPLFAGFFLGGAQPKPDVIVRLTPFKHSLPIFFKLNYNRHMPDAWRIQG
jgi:hypothetical protein